MDAQTVEDIVYDDYEEEYNSWITDHPELDWFEFAHEYLGYVYVDATMQGASQPYFVEGNNLRVEETNDEPITFESKEVKTESLRPDTVNAIDLTINEIDNGNSDDPEWFAEKYKTYDDLVKGVYELLNSNLKNGFGIDNEPTSATKFSGKDEIFAEIKKQLADWGYTEEYFNKKKEEDCTQASSVDAGRVDLVGSKEREVKTEGKLNKKEIVDGFPAYTKSIGLEPEEADTSILGEYIADIASFNIVDDEDLEILNDADDEIRTKYNLSEPEVWDEDLYESKKVKTEKEKKEEYYQMSEDEHIIWDSEDSIDDYDMDEMKELYQDYLDNFNSTYEPLSFEDWLDSEDCADYFDYMWEEVAKRDSRYEEWANFIVYYVSDEEKEEAYDEYLEHCKNITLKPNDFETWFDNYRIDTADDTWNWKEEDLKDNIFPEIDKQLKDDVLLLRGNYGSNYADFRPSGAGGRLFEKGTDDFRDYMSGFDRVCITTQNGVLGAILNDHDGTVSGQFYTIPDGEKFYEMLKLMGFEDIVRESYTDEDFEKYDLNDLMETEFNDSLYYNGLESRDFEVASDLLVPIKDTISIYTPQGPEGNKTESKDKTPSKTMYMVMGKYDNGWETVYTSEDKEDAEARLKEYDDNEKEYPHKIMSRSVDLLKDKKVTESEDLSYTDSNADNCKVYYAVNNSGYKSLGLIVNETDKKFQIVAGQKLRSGSKTAKKSKKQIWDMAKELSDKGYEEVRGPSSVAGSVKEESYETQKERTLNDIIDYNFEEAYKDWGSKSFDSKAGFVNNYLEAFSNDVIDGDIDYIEVYEKEIPELKDADKDTKYKLITDYVKNYLNKKYKKEEVHEDMKKEEKEKLVEENGRASIDLHTDLLPIINMYKYELSQRLEDLVDVTVEEEDELMLDYAKPKIEEEIKSVLPSAEITFGEFSHPRYYKLFTNLNDTLDFTVSYDVSEYEALREKVLHEPEFEQYLKDNYSSYDGFMSFMANNITDFETQEDWKQWVSVVSYCLPNDRNENYQEMLDYVEENLYSTHENIEMAIDYMYETIETKVREEGMELTKENITKVVEETYINSDSFEYILDGVLREFGLDENKQITENVNINVSEDGKAVEIITDDNEEVNVIDETEEPENSDEENQEELIEPEEENELKENRIKEEKIMKKQEGFSEDLYDTLNGDIGAKRGKKIKDRNSWYGIKGAKYNYYGDWSDPMVELDGYEYDYYDIEEYVLQCMEEDYKEEGKVIPEENTKEYEAVFNNYMEMEAKNALMDLIPYRIASWLEDAIKYTYSVADLDKLIQTLREDTSTPETTINEIEELVNKEKDYVETNNISVDHEEEIVKELQPKIKEILNDMSKYAENMYN